MSLQNLMQGLLYAGRKVSLTTSALFGATMTKDSIYDYEVKV